MDNSENTFSSDENRSEILSAEKAYEDLDEIKSFKEIELLHGPERRLDLSSIIKLHSSFGDLTRAALNNIRQNILHGRPNLEIFLIIGNAGQGKSTTSRLLNDILSAEIPDIPVSNITWEKDGESIIDNEDRTRWLTNEELNLANQNFLQNVRNTFQEEHPKTHIIKIEAPVPLFGHRSGWDVRKVGHSAIDEVVRHAYTNKNIRVNIYCPYAGKTILTKGLLFRDRLRYTSNYAEACVVAEEFQIGNFTEEVWHAMSLEKGATAGIAEIYKINLLDIVEKYFRENSHWVSQLPMGAIEALLLEVSQIQNPVSTFNPSHYNLAHYYYLGCAFGSFTLSSLEEYLSIIIISKARRIALESKNKFNVAIGFNNPNF